MSDEQYTNLSNIRTTGKVMADEQVETPIVKSATVIADEIKKSDGKEYALKEYVDAEAKKKTDNEVNTSGGISRISNTIDDEGGCITFTHNDTSISGIGVNNKGLNGIAAQIYALDGTKVGTRINVTQQKIYYTKKGDATYTDVDEIATMRDLDDTKAIWGKITGSMSDQVDLSAKFKSVDDAIALTDTTLKAEVERSKAEDVRLGSELETEKNRAIAKENEAITLITGEITRAQAVEGDLDKKIGKKVTKTSIWGATNHEGWFNSEESKIEVFYKGDKDTASDVRSVSGITAYNSQDANSIGLHIYATKGENGTSKGSSIMGYNDKFFYTNIGNMTGSRPNDDLEIATIRDVQKLSGTFRGNYATKALLDAYAGEKYKNDYAIVNADETHDNATARYSYSGSVWQFEYKIEVKDVIKLLGDEPGSGQPYNFPFHFEVPVQNANTITTTMHTITLDNLKTTKTFPITIPSADITSDKAGLYNKTLADRKQDRIVDVLTTAMKAEWQPDGTTGYYKQSKTIEGITTESYPILSPNYDGCKTLAQYEELQEASSHILKAETGNGMVTFYANEIPSLDIPMILKVM